MKFVLILLGCVFLLAILLFVIRRANSPLGKPCSICSGEAKFGYSKHAEEDAKKIKPMCLTCLVSQLKKDYSSFAGRAVVIQPAAGPPCYVFQPVKEWQAYFKESKIGPDVNSLLSKMEPQCHDCGQKANYKPISLCAKCVVGRIAKDMRYKQISYLEVCGPKGDDNGFVIPMGY